MIKYPTIFLTIIILVNIFYASYLKAEERDPFVSLIELEKEKLLAQGNKIDLSKIFLKGIIWNESKAVAIINDQLVMVGDDWQGFKIERIDKDSVTLSGQGEFYKVFVKEAVPLNKGVPLSDKKDSATTNNLELPTPDDLRSSEMRSSRERGLPAGKNFGFQEERSAIQRDE